MSPIWVASCSMWLRCCSSPPPPGRSGEQHDQSSSSAMRPTPASDIGISAIERSNSTRHKRHSFSSLSRSLPSGSPEIATRAWINPMAALTCSTRWLLPVIRLVVVTESFPQMSQIPGTVRLSNNTRNATIRVGIEIKGLGH